jgi:hypothetical protein
MGASAGLTTRFTSTGSPLKRIVVRMGDEAPRELWMITILPPAFFQDFISSDDRQEATESSLGKIGFAPEPPPVLMAGRSGALLKFFVKQPREFDVSKDVRMRF